MPGAGPDSELLEARPSEKEVKASSLDSLNPWSGVLPTQYVSQLSVWAWESDI